MVLEGRAQQRLSSSCIFGSLKPTAGCTSTWATARRGSSRLAAANGMSSTARQCCSAAPSSPVPCRTRIPAIFRGCGIRADRRSRTRPLVLAWLVQALIQADVPHPILALLAEQGSAKSSVTGHGACRCWTRRRCRCGNHPATERVGDRRVRELGGRAGQPLGERCRSGCLTGCAARRPAMGMCGDSSTPIPTSRWSVPAGGDRQRRRRRGGPRRSRRAAAAGGPGSGRPNGAARRNWPRVVPTRTRTFFGALLDLAAKVHHRLPAVEWTTCRGWPTSRRCSPRWTRCWEREGLARYRRAVEAGRGRHPRPPVHQRAGRAGNCRSPSGRRRNTGRAETNRHRTGNLRGSGRRTPAPSTGQLTRHAPALRAQGWTSRTTPAAITATGCSGPSDHQRWTAILTRKTRRLATRTDSRTSGTPSQRESEPEKPASQHGVLTRGNSQPSRNSQPEMPLTSADEPASHASHENTPSLDRPPLFPRCERAPARSDTRLCDYCTTRQRTVHAAEVRLGEDAS